MFVYKLFKDFFMSVLFFTQPVRLLVLLKFNETES